MGPPPIQYLPIRLEPEPGHLLTGTSSLAAELSNTSELSEEQSKLLPCQEGDKKDREELHRARRDEHQAAGRQVLLFMESL